MNTPKKPGTDLAALKARLAKKSKDGEEAAAPAPAEAPPAAHQPPADFGHAAAQPHYEPQAGFDAPAASFAPAEVHHHAPAAAAPSFSPPASDDPFGGPAVNASYDPGPDLGGEVPGRSNVGVIAFSGVIFLLVGLGIGWLGHKIVSGRDMVDKGKTKGDEMYKEVQEVAKARKEVAVKLETEIGKQVMADPKAGSQAIIAVLSETFEKFPRLDKLFGWQLASVNKQGVTKVFELYEKSTRVRIELAALAGFLEQNADALKESGGPVSFGVKFTPEGAQMIALTSALCSETPADPASLKPCEDPGKAAAFKVQETLGGEEKVLVKGTGENQVMFLPPSGQIYNYAVGLEPKKNAANVREFMMKRVKETVDDMAKAEAAALKTLSYYAENPDVDGSVDQPDP